MEPAARCRDGCRIDGIARSAPSNGVVRRTAGGGLDCWLCGSAGRPPVPAGVLSARPCAASARIARRWRIAPHRRGVCRCRRTPAPIYPVFCSFAVPQGCLLGPSVSFCARSTGRPQIQEWIPIIYCSILSFAGQPVCSRWRAGSPADETGRSRPHRGRMASWYA